MIEAAAQGVTLVSLFIACFLIFVRGHVAPAEVPKPGPYDRQLPRCKCSQRGEPVSIVAHDTPDGAEYVIRVLCSTCWLTATNTSPKPAWDPETWPRPGTGEPERSAPVIVPSAPSGTWNRVPDMLSQAYQAQQEHCLLCTEPEYDDIFAHRDGVPVRRACGNCGRSEDEHGEFVSVDDPETGEHLGAVRRGDDGETHLA